MSNVCAGQGRAAMPRRHGFCRFHPFRSRYVKQVDVPPEGDTLVLFLSDELEHEVSWKNQGRLWLWIDSVGCSRYERIRTCIQIQVLPNHDEREEHHRITYTLWLVQEGEPEQDDA